MCLNDGWRGVALLLVVYRQRCREQEEAEGSTNRQDGDVCVRWHEWIRCLVLNRSWTDSGFDWLTGCSCRVCALSPTHLFDLDSRSTFTHKCAQGESRWQACGTFSFKLLKEQYWSGCRPLRAWMKSQSLFMNGHWFAVTGCNLPTELQGMCESGGAQIKHSGLKSH